MLFAIPALLDAVSSVVSNTALTMCSPSVFSVLRSSNIFVTAALSYAFDLNRFRDKFRAQQAISLVLLSVGLAVVTLSENTASGRTTLWGPVLSILAGFLTALFQVTEQCVGRRNNAPVFLSVGLEGLFGIIGIAVFGFASGTRGATRNAILDILYHLTNYPRLRALAAGYCAITIANMVSGYLLTHTAGAATRATFNSVRPYIVFVAGLALGLESFTLRRQTGYAVSVGAVMMFNDVVVVFVEKGEEEQKKSLA